jgi:hypothetical protein
MIFLTSKEQIFVENAARKKMLFSEDPNSVIKTLFLITVMKSNDPHLIAGVNKMTDAALFHINILSVISIFVFLHAIYNQVR